VQDHQSLALAPNEARSCSVAGKTSAGLGRRTTNTRERREDWNMEDERLAKSYTPLQV